MSGHNAALCLPFDERPPAYQPDAPEQSPHGDAEATTSEEPSPLPRGGHCVEYDAALAASVKNLRAALDAHVTLLSLDPDNARSRIANRYASSNNVRASELGLACALALDKKIERSLRP